MLSKHILVVDDEARIREVVQYALEREGFRVTAVGDGQEAVDALPELQPQLIVLDVMLPGLDGLEVCRQIRKHARTPILFLSARDDEIDRVLGLELGGDDYLTKPFSPRELVARVRAVLRRTQFAAEAREGATSAGSAAVEAGAALRHGALEVDVERHEANYGGQPITLTATELGLLAALLERPGVVLSRGQLMRRAYAYDNLVTERTIDTHVRRIRSKFRPFEHDPIATVYGVGYKVSEA